MDAQPFTIGNAIKEGWRLTKEYIGFFIGYQIILYLLTIVFGVSHGWKWAPWHILGWILVVLVKMGLYNSALLTTVGIKPGFDQLYKNWRLFISWVVASFLFGIMFIIGLILLIFPGCYVLAKYGLFPFFILDKNLGPIEALKQTGQATKGIRGKVFLLFLACFGLDILGVLCFGIGLLITVPITLIALAYVYRRIAYPDPETLLTY